MSFTSVADVVVVPLDMSGSRLYVPTTNKPGARGANSIQLGGDSRIVCAMELITGAD